MGEDYVLGHRAEKLARLDGQAKMLEPATRLALQLAGIGPGMRVVDLGTGTARSRCWSPSWSRRTWRRTPPTGRWTRCPAGVYLALEYDTRGRPRRTQTLGPHLAGMLREAGAPDAQSLGLQAYLGPDDPLVPAMLSGVPAMTGHPG